MFVKFCPNIDRYRANVGRIRAKLDPKSNELDRLLPNFGQIWQISTKSRRSQELWNRFWKTTTCIRDPSRVCVNFCFCHLESHTLSHA